MYALFRSPPSLSAATALTAFERIVKRAIEPSESPDVDRPSRALNLPLDLYRYEVFMTMQAVRDETIIEIIDQIWLPLMYVQPGFRNA
jgi:hypothetical protein